MKTTVVNRINNARDIIRSIDRRQCSNNTQRVLYSMLTARDEWVPLSQIRVESAAARLRDLRKPEFGNFKIECSTASQLGKTGVNGRKTFYRLVPSSVTPAKVKQVFKGVIATAKSGT